MAEDFNERVEREMANFDVGQFFDGLETPVHGLARAYKEVAEIFESHGDFNRSQALYLTAAMFNGNPGIAPGD